jgi:4'-phosphopantetheinyl transferase EntD
VSADGAAREELDLARFRAALAPFGVLVAARRIGEGDEAAFVNLDRPATAANLASRRASGAARIAARGLLRELGGDASAPLRRLPSRAPEWPKGFLGSLSHDAEFALAAVARANTLAALGVDIEPAEPLPGDILEMVMSPWERRSIGDDLILARLIFCAKEAAYKAFNPLDGSALEFEDVEVRMAESRAALRDGRSARLIFDVGPRLLAAAVVDGSRDPAPKAPGP